MRFQATTRRTTRRIGTLLAGVLLLPAAAAVPSASAASPLVEAAKKAKAQREKEGEKQTKVWTNAELLRLRSQPGSRVMFLDTTPNTGLPEVTRTRFETAASVVGRYREMISEADREIARLEREKLAARNPYLRGLVEGGPRSPALIEADLERARARRASADANLRKASVSAGIPVPKTPPPPGREPAKDED